MRCLCPGTFRQHGAMRRKGAQPSHTHSPALYALPHRGHTHTHWHWQGMNGGLGDLAAAEFQVSQRTVRQVLPRARANRRRVPKKGVRACAMKATHNSSGPRPRVVTGLKIKMYFYLTHCTALRLFSSPPTPLPPLRARIMAFSLLRLLAVGVASAVAPAATTLTCGGNSTPSYSKDLDVVPWSFQPALPKPSLSGVARRRRTATPLQVPTPRQRGAWAHSFAQRRRDLHAGAVPAAQELQPRGAPPILPLQPAALHQRHRRPPALRGRFPDPELERREHAVLHRQVLRQEPGPQAGPAVGGDGRNALQRCVPRHGLVGALRHGSLAQLCTPLSAASA